MRATANSEQISQTAHAVDVAHDFDGVPEIAIEDEILPNGKMPNTTGDVVARHADLGVTGERLAFPVENIEKPVGRGGIVAGNVCPDTDQILFSLRRARQTRLALAHGAALAARRRASFLIASID